MSRPSIGKDACRPVDDAVNVPAGDVVRLTVTHDRLEADSDMLEGISKGWPKVLSSLKSLLERGQALPELW